MGRKWRVLTALLLGFALVAGACGSDDEEAAPASTTAAPAATTAAPAATTAAPAATTAAPAAEDLTIGVFMAMTGPTDYEGIQAMNGCLPAVYRINEAGGVLGSQVELSLIHI